MLKVHLKKICKIWEDYQIHWKIMETATLQYINIIAERQRNILL